MINHPSPQVFMAKIGDNTLLNTHLPCLPVADQRFGRQPKSNAWVISSDGQVIQAIPSGQHTKNYGKSPFLMGKSTINGHFQ